MPREQRRVGGTSRRVVLKTDETYFEPKQEPAPPSWPPPWFTPADQAELNTKVREFSDKGFLHMQECEECRDGCACPWLRDAVEELLLWRETRSDTSLAADLRAAENLLDGRRLP